MKLYSLCGVERTGLLRESALIIHIKPVEHLKAKSFMQTFLKRFFLLFLWWGMTFYNAKWIKWKILDALLFALLYYCLLLASVTAEAGGARGPNGGNQRLFIGVEAGFVCWGLFKRNGIEQGWGYDSNHILQHETFYNGTAIYHSVLYENERSCWYFLFLYGTWCTQTKWSGAGFTKCY